MREVSVLARNIDEAEIRSRDPDHRRSPICGSRMEGLLAKIICCKIGFFMPMNWSFGDTERPEIPARSVLFLFRGLSQAATLASIPQPLPHNQRIMHA